MRRLRLVEEYRGRRIVTDGQLYGIRAELITDCRYLDVAGARAAVDSELGIARRQKDYDWQREKAAEYIAREGQEWAYACECGWRGRYNKLKWTREPLFFSCPACSSAGIMFSMGADPAEELPAHARRRRTAKKNKRVGAFRGDLERSETVVHGPAMLVVDPWHWLDPDGHFLVNNPRLYRRMLRVARFIEYGGPLKKNEMRETLVECKRRPKNKPCVGLMWVVKTADGGILGHCIVCRSEEILIHNWQETEWAAGPMDPVMAVSHAPPVTH